MTALVLAALLAVPAAETEAIETAPVAAIALETVAEDGRRAVVAVVTAGGEPVADARITFFVRRSFGLLPIGDEWNATDEDGRAEAEVPADLIGDAFGTLEVIGRYEPDDPADSIAASISVPWGSPRPIGPASADVPRALWAPRAPVWLIALFAVVFGGVWGVYAYIVRQLVAIRREGADSEGGSS